MLRRNQGMIIHFCTKLFAGVFPEVLILDCLVSAFLPSLPESEAREKIKQMVASGEASNKKKFKDLWHQWTKKTF